MHPPHAGAPDRPARTSVMPGAGWAPSPRLRDGANPRLVTWQVEAEGVRHLLDLGRENSALCCFSERPHVLVEGNELAAWPRITVLQGIDRFFASQSEVGGQKRAQPTWLFGQHRSGPTGREAERGPPQNPSVNTRPEEEFESIGDLKALVNWRARVSS